MPRSHPKFLPTKSFVAHIVTYEKLARDIENVKCVPGAGDTINFGKNQHINVWTVDVWTRSSATAEKQRVSCPNGGRGLGPPDHSPSAPSGYTYAYGRIRKPQRTYVKLGLARHGLYCNIIVLALSLKRTLRWIGHSRSFKVIIIGAGRNPEWSVVVMCN